VRDSGQGSKERTKPRIFTDPSRIYLTGFMGCGKSTIGPILANMFGYTFVDLDAEIAARAGMSIPEIFAEYGEEAFRTMETEQLKTASPSTPAVVSLGGGVLGRRENMHHIRATGILLYLHMDLDTAVRRLRRNRRRPMLWDDDGSPLRGERLRARVQELLESRLDGYERAHIHVPTAHRSVGKNADRIAAAIRSWTLYH
jgi:shikimate kinase